MTTHDKIERPVVVGISGASGSVLAQATVEELLRRDVGTAVVCTNSARMVWQEEMECSFGERLSEWREHPRFAFYQNTDLRAPIASGTYPAAGMVMVPASMNSIGALANGMSNNLLLRAADVCLKERRPLALVPRESPLHSIHLENLLTLSRMGAVIIPPEPAFYLKPRGLDDVVSFVVGRVMLALGLDETMPSGMQYRGSSE